MITSVSRFELVAAELRALGVTVAARPGEYAVNYRNDTDETALYTDDLDDALELGRTFAAALPATDQPPHTASTPRRRRGRRKMTPKAQRRRMIRKHNRRLHARAIRQG